MENKVLEELKSILGADWVITDKESIAGYLYDETPPLLRPKASEDVVVVKPKNAEEVSKIMKLANKYKIPVFPRGGGTGLVGACIPTMNGIVLSLERMNEIKVDAENLIAEAGAGATLRDLIDAAEEAGLSFLLHPGDEGAHIGGLISCNAGGARAIKTGIMRNCVKGIEVVVFPARWWKRLLGQKQEWKTIFHLEENKDQYSTHITGVGKNNITIKGL